MDHLGVPVELLAAGGVALLFAVLGLATLRRKASRPKTVSSPISTPISGGAPPAKAAPSPRTEEKATTEKVGHADEGIRIVTPSAGNRPKGARSPLAEKPEVAATSDLTAKAKQPFDLAALALQQALKV